MSERVPPLHEAFANPSETLVQISSAFIDQTDSTGMQQNQPEGAWVPQLGWFYRVLSEEVESLHTLTGAPVDVKYLGDGVMVTVSNRWATELINFAVEVQEKVCKANRRDTDGGAGQIDFNVTIGVVTGKAYRFQSPDGLTDYVSKTISTARRLCDIASPRAVLVDHNTERTANGFQITSRLGRAHDRGPAEYFGDSRSIALKGLNNKIEFFEILWESSRFGVKGEVAESGNTPTPAAAVVPASPTPTSVSLTDEDRPRRTSGTVKMWNPEKGFGFIVDAAGESFYFNRGLLAYAEDVEDITFGDRVAFMALPASGAGRARQAAVVLFDGESAEGVVQSAPNSTRTYGWIAVEDARGTRHFVWVAGDALPPGVSSGAKVEFLVKIGNQGATATELKLPEVEPRPAAA